MKQFTTLVAKASFSMKVTGTRGRPVMVSIGDKFMVTSPDYRNIDTVTIDRCRRARLNQGHLINKDQVKALFEIEGN